MSKYCNTVGQADVFVLWLWSYSLSLTTFAEAVLYSILLYSPSRMVLPPTRAYHFARPDPLLTATIRASPQLYWTVFCLSDPVLASVISCSTPFFISWTVFPFCHRFDLRRSPLRTRWIVRASLSGFTILNTRCPSFGSFTFAMPAFYLISGYYKIRSGVPPQKWRWAPLLREVEVFSHFWIWYCRI